MIRFKSRLRRACAAALLFLVPVPVASAAETAAPVASPAQPVAFYTTVSASRSAVTVADIVREAHFMSRDETMFRAARNLGGRRAVEDWARRATLRELSRAEAAHIEELATDPAVGEAARAAGRSWWLARWRLDCYGIDVEEPDERHILAAADIPPPRPPRLRLSHLFLEAESPEEIERAAQELTRLRTEVTDLDSFRRLAESRSQSLSARSGGSLGWLRKGWIPDEAWHRLWTLPEGTVSEPMALRGGVHLFFVEARRPAEVPPIEPALRKARARLLEVQRDDCRRRRLEEHPLEPNLRDDLVHVGDWRAPAAAVADVELWSEDERLLQLALALGQPSDLELARIRDLESDVWMAAWMAHRLAARVGEPPTAELDALYTADQSRLKRQMHLAGRALAVRPGTDEDPLEFLDRLQSAAASLKHAEDALADSEWHRLGEIFPAADVQAWQPEPALEVADRLGPRVFQELLDQKAGAGDVIGPLQVGPEFWLVAVSSVEPMRPLDRAEAEPRLRARWTGVREKAERAELVREILASAEFELVASGVDAALAALDAVDAVDAVNESDNPDPAQPPSATEDRDQHDVDP